jgi:hypothetical protein
MGRVFFGIAAIFFFLLAVGSSLLPNATGWGLCATAIGLLIGGWTPPGPWRKPA